MFERIIKMATEFNQSDFVHTNVRFFYEIAKESYEVMKDEFDSHRRPKPGGEPGWILTWDPDHKSFKKAFVTIVFCGVWFEAVLHLLIVKHKGVEVFKKYDRTSSYEGKLELLGCTDKSIIELWENGDSHLFLKSSHACFRFLGVIYNYTLF